MAGTEDAAEQLTASVIVPSRRGDHRLPTLLSRLAAQKVEDDWEVVVVLDGAHDPSLAVLRRWQDALPLRILVFDEPRGVVAALNFGYAEARGRVLIRCDDDLAPGPDMVRRHVEWHRDRDDIGVIGATRDIFGTSRYAAAYGRPANARMLQQTYARPPQDRWVSWAAHNSLTRATWDRLGGFNPAFPYSEDNELGLRLLEAGVDLIVDPALEIDHTSPADSVRERAERAFVSGVARVAIERAHPAKFRNHTGGTSLWNVAVGTLAHVARDRQSCGAAGGVVDGLLHVAPPTVGGRLAGFVVEAAGRSGRRQSNVDLSDLPWARADTNPGSL